MRIPIVPVDQVGANFVNNSRPLVNSVESARVLGPNGAQQLLTVHRAAAACKKVLILGGFPKQVRLSEPGDFIVQAFFLESSSQFACTRSGHVAVDSSPLTSEAREPPARPSASLRARTQALVVDGATT